MTTSYYTSLIIIISFLLIQSNALNTNFLPSFVTKDCVRNTSDYSLFLNGDSRASLMTDLILNAPNKTFYSTKSTTGNNTSYGQFYCTANTGAEACQTCVEMASKYCTLDMAGFVFHEECTLRYSMMPMLGIADYETVTGWKYSLTPATYNNFSDRLYSTLNRAILPAVNSSTRFAIEESDLKGTTEKLYALAQCTPDIVAGDCDTCLKTALRKMPLCNQSTCGNPLRMSIMTLVPSCQLRYEVRYPSSTYGTIQSSPSTTGKTDVIRNTVLPLVGALGCLLLLFGCIISMKLCTRRLLAYQSMQGRGPAG